MDTRVGMQSIYQNAIIGNQQITAQLQALQAQATTGQKFAQVSDDPAAALSLLSTTDQEQRLTAHLANIQSATTALNTSVAALQQVNDIFTQAKSLAIQASSANNDPTSYAALADQINGLINNLLTAANTQSNGTYVFSGTASATKPFTIASQDSSGNVQRVGYQAAAAGASATVADAQQVELYYPGSSVFQMQNRQTAVFSGTTGAAPGTGTDSATSQAALTIQHTATTFAAGSGVQAGTNSAAGDTILGPAGAHTLQITDTSGNGTAGTVSLDGGPAIAFTNADTNLRVTNNTGDVAFLDTSAITAGFNGNVALTASGNMSIDGGATSTPLTFSGNQAVTDGTTGAVTFVDTTKVVRAGTEIVQYPGTSDAFQALISLRDDLNNVNHLSSADQLKALTGHIADLDNVSTHILSTLGQQSASLQSLGSLQSHLTALQLSAKETIGNVGNADITDVVVKLQSYEQLLQLSLAAFAQIHSISLLNYLK